MPLTLPKRRLISINISIGSYKQFVAAIIGKASTKVSSYVCVANVHMLLEAYESRHFRKVVNASYLTTPDGMPIAKGIQSVYQIKQERVDGMSLLPNLLKEAEINNLSVYFYGATHETLNTTKEYLTLHYPNLKLAGFYSPPFRPLTDDEMEKTAKNINDSGANIVFVVLGCPKQEIWMYNMKGKINSLMIGIGGALPVFLGQQKRAPYWMQQNSLEWLYRLHQEPRRLFRRYFKTNSQYLYLILKSNIKRNKR